MDQQGHTDAFHGEQNTVNVAEVCYSCCGIGCGIRGIELGGGENTINKTAFNLGWSDVIL
jgi:hypothetical protein